jgi:23S rRNA (cytidine1920-2'-O)/16S rRNA (cytidine1409-2'-O)-methyltransferase
MVEGKIVTKNSEQIEESAAIEVSAGEEQYVGRGGNKLEGALAEFKIKPKDYTVLDVGASTGGFTECLLRQDAKKVYAIDVGTDQLDPKLKGDPRVVSLEQTDIRNVTNFSEKIDLAVIDVSFISLELVLGKVKELISESGKIIALVKPQFETKKSDKNKSGVVKTDELRKETLVKIKKFCAMIDLKVLNEMDSPILGGSGNKEYFLLLQK